MAYASCRAAGRALHARAALRRSWPMCRAIPNSCRGATAGALRQREGADVEIAELAIGFGPFHEKFVSRVVLAPDAAAGRASTRPASRGRSAG